MKIKISKRKLIPIIIVALIIGGIFFLLQGPPEPKEFVENRTFETFENLLFKYEITRYPSNVSIVSQTGENVTVGIVTDPWNLNFGRIPIQEDIYGTRRFVILTNKEEDAKVEFKAYGSISPLVNFSKNNFILRTDENVTVDVTIQMSKDINPGNYLGEIDIVIIKPKYGFVYLFWVGR
jgi:hypothetical protein